MKIKVKLLNNFDPKLNIPKFMTSGAAGADIAASLEDRGYLIIKPMQRILVPTGLSLEIPEGYEVQIRPRSGISYKTGLMIPNSPATIDSDYRGEIKIIMANISNFDEYVRHGDRIAQLVINKIYQSTFEIVQELSSTDRGEGGFGHTSINTP